MAKWWDGPRWNGRRWAYSQRYISLPPIGWVVAIIGLVLLIVAFAMVGRYGQSVMGGQGTPPQERPAAQGG